MPEPKRFWLAKLSLTLVVLLAIGSCILAAIFSHWFVLAYIGSGSGLFMSYHWRKPADIKVSRTAWSAAVFATSIYFGILWAIYAYGLLVFGQSPQSHYRYWSVLDLVRRFDETSSV